MKREIRNVRCPTCGKIFETKRREQKFCSFACARAMGNGRKPLMEKRVCRICQKEFEIKMSDHRVKEGAEIFCSRECYLQSRYTGQDVICPICGKMFYTTRCKCCSVECGRIYKKQNYKHKSYVENGYWVEYQNGYNKKGNIKQHRRIMEEYLGRRLAKNEIVHHINGNKMDNRIENLQAMTRGEHSSLHRKQEKKEGKHLFGGYHNN